MLFSVVFNNLWRCNALAAGLNQGSNPMDKQCQGVSSCKNQQLSYHFAQQSFSCRANKPNHPHEDQSAPKGGHIYFVCIGGALAAGLNRGSTHHEPMGQTLTKHTGTRHTGGTEAHKRHTPCCMCVAHIISTYSYTHTGK